MLLAIAAVQKWHLVQWDVNNVFLNGDLFQEIYMDLPLEYSKQPTAGTQGEKLVCKLHNQFLVLNRLLENGSQSSLKPLSYMASICQSQITLCSMSMTLSS